MGKTMVVLAAGLATRFGGLKQLAPVGPAGEALMDFTLADSRAAGFDRVVVVVRREIEEEMAAHVARVARAVPGLRVDLVRQEQPLGSAHALLACREVLDEPFAVANADDYYGAHAVASLRRFLDGARPHTAAVVGYRLASTLSAVGGVSRAVCRVREDHTLEAIAEHRDIRRAANAIRSDTDDDLPADAVVSMSLWGFTTTIFVDLGERFERFRTRRADDREFSLPDVVGDLVAEDRLQVTVLPTDDRWLGITYAEDLPAVRDAIDGHVHEGRLVLAPWEPS